MIFDERQLKEYGQQLGSRLKAGAVIALTGELGVGKTTLAKAIALGLGVEELVTSPTFTLINEYTSGRLPLYHFDVYRLGEMAAMETPKEDGLYDSASHSVWSELVEIGYEDYFYGDGVCIVEWADKIEGLLPDGTLSIELAYTDDPDLREVSDKNRDD
jgi:tRNA threonylcarbamoyladenosine biosynthesis protein TsaE